MWRRKLGHPDPVNIPVCNQRRVLSGIILTLLLFGMISGCQKAAESVQTAPSPVWLIESQTPAFTPTATKTHSPTPTHTLGPPILIAPTSPATRVPVACVDEAELVIHLSIPPVEAGSFPISPQNNQIKKGWRVQNIGTCTWDSAYQLTPAQQNPDWAAASQPVVGRIMPGEMTDFWIDLMAPSVPGVYEAQWSLQNGAGEAFGPPLTLGLEVAPFPAGTQAPEITLVASPLEVAPGEQAVISWIAHQAKRAYFYRSGQAWQEHPVDVSGNLVVEPERTTTYELRIVKGDDTVETRRITIEVLPYDLPKIRSFSLKPADAIDLGQCVDILWRVTGRVHTVTVLRNGEHYWTSKDETGNTWDCPASRGVYQYTLRVVGPGGVVEAELALEVR